MQAISLETSGTGWFAEDALPDALSPGRVLPAQVRRMFAHACNSGLATDYE